MSTTQHSTCAWPGTGLQRDFMHSEATGKASATCSLAATGDPSPGREQALVTQNGGLLREKTHFLWGQGLLYVCSPFPRTFLCAWYTVEFLCFFLNEWNLGALWICLVDIKIANFYLCKNETAPQKLLLWELCAFYVNITLITANTNWQQLPHTKPQLKGTMPGPLRTCFTWLLENIRKYILEFLGKGREMEAPRV